MDDYQNEAMPVGAAEVAAATQTLQRYKAGKAALDRRLVDNELWFRMSSKYRYVKISADESDPPGCPDLAL